MPTLPSDRRQAHPRGAAASRLPSRVPRGQGKIRTPRGPQCRGAGRPAGDLGMRVAGMAISPTASVHPTKSGRWVGVRRGLPLGHSLHSPGAATRPELPGSHHWTLVRGSHSGRGGLSSAESHSSGGAAAAWGSWNGAGSASSSSSSHPSSSSPAGAGAGLEGVSSPSSRRRRGVLKHLQTASLQVGQSGSRYAGSRPRSSQVWVAESVTLVVASHLLHR
jgi:hypothetical protein